MKIYQCLRLQIKNDMLKVLHCNIADLLTYTHQRCMKCLFTNIKKQKNMLKVALFKKDTNFTGK